MSTDTAIASLRALDDRRGAVRVDRVFATDIDDLWSAVTEPERMARWIGTVEGDLGVGRTVHAELTSSWHGPVRIEVCDAPTHLRITMEPGTEEETVTEAWLSAEGDGTRLVVEETGLPLDSLYAYGAGWQAHVEDLARYLTEGGTSTWHERWAELSPTYRAMEIS